MKNETFEQSHSATKIKKEDSLEFFIMHLVAKYETI